MKIKTLFTIALFLTSFFSFSQNMSIKMDGVKITFLAEKDKTSGSISGFTASINFNSADLLNSSITGTVDVNTLNTGNKKRDAHLKSADYFEVEKYGTISFTSTQFIEKGGIFEMTGILKIKGKEHKEVITFSFKDNTFIGEASISLVNYDLGDFSTGKKPNVKINFLVPVN